MTIAGALAREDRPKGRALVVMARRPTPGATKTRLCPPLSSDQAAQLYEALLLDTLAAAERVECEGRLIAYTPDSEPGYFTEMAPNFSLLPQGEGTLGDRLDRSLSYCFQEGYGVALALGSDSPALPPGHVDRAFRLLQDSDLVLGPCEDGGYYLAGLSRPVGPVFGQITMSTPRVLADTLELARRMGLQTALAPTYWDLDTAEDLVRLNEMLASSPSAPAAHTRRTLSHS